MFQAKAQMEKTQWSFYLKYYAKHHLRHKLSQRDWSVRTKPSEEIPTGR